MPHSVMAQSLVSRGRRRRPPMKPGEQPRSSGGLHRLRWGALLKKKKHRYKLRDITRLKKQAPLLTRHQRIVKPISKGKTMGKAAVQYKFNNKSLGMILPVSQKPVPDDVTHAPESRSASASGGPPGSSESASACWETDGHDGSGRSL